MGKLNSLLMKAKILISLVLLLSSFDFVPNRTLTGTVTDMALRPLPGVMVHVKGSNISTQSDKNGKFAIHVPGNAHYLRFTYIGYVTREVKIGADSVINISLAQDNASLSEVVIVGYSKNMNRSANFQSAMDGSFRSAVQYPMPVTPGNTENYNPINENSFQNAGQTPVTTFSIDVDRAAYSNVRRFLNTGQMPPIDAVRIEEMINYFEYQYPQPKGTDPVSVTTEMTHSPWNPGHKLVHIGLQAKKIPTGDLPASNLVFLIDVSGSMMDQNKLPLLKQAFKLLVDQLREIDKVSVVVYAGAAGVVLPPTSGKEKMKIKESLDQLTAGGSTAGGQGINLAYKLAHENFIPKGNNRIILATDGDFNVGVSSEGALQRLVEEKRKGGVYLSILGFGMGNYKDSHVETLADKGNGNYAYIDNIQEALKVFVTEFGGTLFTVAKDVKLQIEFNPRHVRAYRLIGYENRAMKNEEFHDDQKDAGDMGSGHTVTAIYEIVPAGVESSYLSKTDVLKYQKTTASEKGTSDELLTIKIRYKKPDSEKSTLLEFPIQNNTQPLVNTSDNLRFSAAVAEFGLLLRQSKYKGNAQYSEVIKRARAAFGKDEEGYRAEFVRLVKITESLDKRTESASTGQQATHEK
jgi:Ca-activated chloride channel family protein